MYDTKGKGTLDKADLRRFAIETLVDMEDLKSFNEKDFNELFKFFD